MKKLIAFGLLLVACRSSMSRKQAPAPGLPGADTPAAAVTAFLDASTAQDLQAMSAVFGTSAGSIRETVPEDELYKREFYIITCTKHDRFRINSEATGPAGLRVLSVDIMFGALTRSTNFKAVMGPQNRWYVNDLDLLPLDDICKARKPGSP